jgi:hypothetical protein
VFTPAEQHASTKWLAVAPPYIPDSVVPTLTRVQGSRFTVFPKLAKRFGGWVRAYSLGAMGSYRNPEEEARTL